MVLFKRGWMAMNSTGDSTPRPLWLVTSLALSLLSSACRQSARPRNAAKCA